MKSVWEGNISFGLVSIPVRLYSPTAQKLIDFKMLCKTHEAPIHYQRRCTHGEEVAWKDSVKGFPISKDQYVIVSKEEIRELRPKSATTIDLIAFIPQGHIDPLGQTHTDCRSGIPFCY